MEAFSETAWLNLIRGCQKSDEMKRRRWIVTRFFSNLLLFFSVGQAGAFGGLLERSKGRAHGCANLRPYRAPKIIGPQKIRPVVEGPMYSSEARPAAPSSSPRARLPSPQVRSPRGDFACVATARRFVFI